MPNNTRSLLLRYGCAALSIFLATGLRLLLDPAMGFQLPFVTLFLAILVTAWYGGFRPALAAIVLGAISALYFLIPPRGSFAVAGWDRQVSVLAFLSTSLGIALLGGAMHAARRRAEASAEAERQANEQLEIRVRERTAELVQINDSLLDAEERVRFLIEGVKEYAVFMLDPSGNVLTWNRGAERNKGYQSEEIIGRHFSCFYPEEDIARGKPERELRQVLAEGRCEDVGWRVRKDGSLFWAHVTITALHDNVGRLRGFAKVTRDITEGKRAEERFRQAVESAPNGMVMINSEGKIVLVNAQTERLFGYGRDELLGQSVELLVPERFRSKHPEYRSGFFANPQVRSMGVGRDLHGQRKDGSEFPVEIGLNPIKTDEGLLVLSAIVDITERKRTEEALQESEQRLRLFIEYAPAALAMFDDQMRYLAVSRRWMSDYGLPDGDIAGRSHYDVFPEVSESWKIVHERALAGEVVRADEDCFVRADGCVRWLRWEVRPWHRAEGGIGGIVIFTEDITDRKMASEALQQANADLECGMRQLAEANRELKAKTQETEAFVYSVSHDLRAPLVNLQGFSKELSRAVQELRLHLEKSDGPHPGHDRMLGILDGPMAKAIRFIQTAVTRLSSIIDALLRLSRAGRVVYQQQCVDVKAVVGRVVDTFRGTTEERGASIQVDDLPPALGDPAAVEQVFANLIGNALNYLDSNRPGGIAVGCLPETRAGLRTYYVKDNGLGITEAGKAKLFQPFQRLHPEAAPGEGLGLAIVQRVVERHGGSIWFESTAGQGSTFFVALPAFPDGASAALLPTAPSHSEKGTHTP